MSQSCEEKVLVWVFPNHESKTSDLEKPILALPIHWIDIPVKLKVPKLGKTASIRPLQVIMKS